MTARPSIRQRLCASLPELPQARRTAARLLRTDGLRLHLIGAALLTVTFLVGLMYLSEKLFTVVPWVSLYEHARGLYVLFDVLFYTMDALIVVLVGLPLAYGCAAIFYAAADGQKKPFVTLFDAFGHPRRYGRAVAVMAALLLPRALVFGLLHLLLQTALSRGGMHLLLLPPALAILTATACFSGLDDALLPLALRHAEEPVPALYRRSLALTRPRLWPILRFKLTYLGWGVLSLLTLGVLFFGHALPDYALSHTLWTDGVYHTDLTLPTTGKS